MTARTRGTHRLLAMAALPPQATYEQLTALRHAIMTDLTDGMWAGDIAEKRKVTLAAAIALFMRPETVSLCRHCTASGFVGAEKCRACAGYGYTTGVGL